MSGVKYTANEYKERREDLMNPYMKNKNAEVQKEIGDTANYGQYVAKQALNAYLNGALSDAELAAIRAMYK
jgi:cation transport regulator ChaC